MAATDGAIITSAVINFVIALIGLLVFSLLRISKNTLTRSFYDPKRTTPAVKVKPHPLPDTLFGWILPTFKYTEPDIIRQCGLDTAIYLRILSYGMQLFAIISIWVIVVVLPTNVTDNETTRLMERSTDYKFSNFDKLSLSNVKGGSQRLWVHVVSVYFITGVALYLLWRYCKESVLLRIQYLGNMRPCGPTHTVLVTDIPAVDDYTKGKIAPSSGGPSEYVPPALSPTTSSPGADVDKAYSPSGKAVVTLPVPVKGGAAAAAGGGGVARKRRPIVRTDNYDVHDTSLDPAVLAKEDLAAGMTPQDLVSSEFELVYPNGSVRAITMVHDQSQLEGLVNEYNQLKQKLEDYIDAIKDKSEKELPLPPAKATLLMGKYGDWGKERYGKGLIKSVPAVPFWTDRLRELERLIAEEQAKAKQLVWPSAFVTFKTRLLQSVSATGLHQHDERTWAVRNAPGPDELIWANLGMTSDQRSRASTIMWVLFWLMTLFYTIPIGAIQGLIDVPKLAKINGLKQFLNNVVIKKLVEAIVPGLVLKIFLALLPAILAFMMKKSGAVSLSEVDFGVVSRFYIFQVILVFFGSVIAGSFFSQASQLVQNPTSIVTVLGTAIPQTSTFFITYIWINIGAIALGFTRIVGLILLWVFTKLSGSPKARDRLYQEQYTTCGTSVTGHTIILLLGLVYSCINPIVCPSALAYFAVAATIEKYNNIFVYRRQYDSAGQMWAKVLNQVMTALYIFQLCMIGLLGIKKFPYTMLIIPVLLPTIAFHYSVLKLFARPWSILSLHDAAELDIKDQEYRDVEASEQEDVSTAYVSPVFKVHQGDVDSLLAEAPAIEKQVEEDVARRKAEKEAQKKNKKKMGCL